VSAWGSRFRKGRKGYAKRAKKIDLCLGVLGVFFASLRERLNSEGVEGWLKSPGHRRNLLDHQATQSGVGVALRSEGTYFFTQIFLFPRPVAR
jgi:hypothetical protein